MLGNEKRQLMVQQRERVDTCEMLSTCRIRIGYDRVKRIRIWGLIAPMGIHRI
jgi:hypothetical protein